MTSVRLQHRAKLLWLVSAMVLIAACGDNAKKVDANVGRTGGAADGGSDGDGQGKPDLGELINGKSLIDAKYKVKVTILGIGACNGEAQLQLNPSFGTTTSAEAAKMLSLTGAIDCPIMGCKIDISQALGGTGGPPPGVTLDPNPLEIKDGAILLKQVGYANYSPARPIAPSFLSAKPEVLQNLSMSVATTATDMTSNKSASGNVHLNMLSFDAPYDASEMGKTFPDTMTFEVTTDGFDGINKASALVFESMQMTLSRKPLALTYLHFRGPISEVLSLEGGGGAAASGCGGAGGAGGGAGGALGGLLGGGGGGGAGGLMGGPLGQIAMKLFTKIIDVKIQADIMSMEGIDPNSPSATEDLGEEIGNSSDSDGSDDSESSNDDEDE